MLHHAFGEHSLSRTMIFEWHLYFKASQVSVEGDEHWGRPSTCKTTENVEKILELNYESELFHIYLVCLWRQKKKPLQIKGDCHINILNLFDNL
jgi:hypothetical protein